MRYLQAPSDRTNIFFEVVVVVVVVVVVGEECAISRKKVFRMLKSEQVLSSLASVTYLRYAVLTSSNESETAVHCCDPALSVLVMLVSRNVFHVVSAL